MRIGVFDSPLGEVVLTGDDDGVAGLLLGPGARAEVPGLPRDDAAFREAGEQLAQWFAGERTAFDLPLAPAGTPFRQRVRDLLRQVPYGTTTTYGALARQLGGLGASRAVGVACARNPLGIVVPCHRVIGADGTLTGFAAGLPRKRWLLAHEQQHSGAPGCADTGPGADRPGS